MSSKRSATPGHLDRLLALCGRAGFGKRHGLILRKGLLQYRRMHWEETVRVGATP